MCFCPITLGPSTLGARAKTRLESSIKKLKSHFIMIAFVPKASQFEHLDIVGERLKVFFYVNNRSVQFEDAAKYGMKCTIVEATEGLVKARRPVSYVIKVERRYVQVCQVCTCISYLEVYTLKCMIMTRLFCAGGGLNMSGVSNHPRESVFFPKRCLVNCGNERTNVLLA